MSQSGLTILPSEVLPEPAGGIAAEVRAALDGQSVVLVGMMGAGKSSVGRRLAAALGLPFCDADFEIERAAGMSVEDIFAEHGEVRFREGEERVIRRLLGSGPLVLATGGGAFMSEASRGQILEKGISIWLRADIDLLMARVMRRDNRPLLKTADPRATMERLLSERAPVYALADIVIESRDALHEVIMAEIIEALARHLGRDGNPASGNQE